MTTKEPSLNQLATKLKEKTEMSNQEIREAAEKTQQKYKPLLSSKKTALMVYAREQKNMTLMEKAPPSLDIENIVPEMNSVDLQAKVKDIDQFSYTKDGEKKKACDLKLKDDTGAISLMLWGEQVEKVDGLEVNDLIELRDAYSNEYQGEVQLGWNEDTEIKKKEKEKS